MPPKNIVEGDMTQTEMIAMGATATAKQFEA